MPKPSDLQNRELTRYAVVAENVPGGHETITSHATTVAFDGSATSGDELPELPEGGPAR